METSEPRPTPEEASAALLAAGSARSELAHRLKTPSWFYTSIGVAIVIQTATLAVGFELQSVVGIGVAVAGFIPLALVGRLQLARFRRMNGVWISGLASRVVFGGGAAASTVHFLAMGVALWAAFEQHWWLAGVCAIAGGVAYALCGALWMRSYRADPATNSRGASIIVVVALIVVVLAAAVMLILQSAH